MNESTTHELLQAAQAAYREKSGNAIVLSQADREALGVRAIAPVRPTLPALSLNYIPRRV